MTASRPPRVLGVVVAFHPPAEIAERLRALAPQVEQVVVVDNTPVEAGAGTPGGLPGNVLWNRLGQNRGIAHALNVGVDAAQFGGYDWILAFDQDTEIDPGYVQRLLAGAGEDSTVGMIVPSLESAGVPGRSGDVRRAITSGSLTRVAALGKAGRFREDFFIDYVDFELCIRLRRAGYRIFQDGSTVLRHRIGAPRTAKVGGLSVVTTNHAPVRRYYKVRNRVVMVREHILDEPLWLGWDILSTGIEAVKILLLEDDKAAKLGMMARGALDGFRLRMGPWRG
jgi:rhamnosyltransferase